MASAGRVVVADGDPSEGTRLAGYLFGRGFVVSHTVSGRDVLTLARAGAVDVLIADVSLADMSGHALVGCLKGIDPRVKVLMTTADYRPELEVSARRIGVVHYAQKPTDYERLEAVVARLLNGRGPR